jgi:excisionase family DNA binding protein
MDATPNLRTLTVKEIAAITNIDARKVRRLVRSGYFPRIALPCREIRVLERDVVVRLLGDEGRDE